MLVGVAEPEEKADLSLRLWRRLLLALSLSHDWTFDKTLKTMTCFGTTFDESTHTSLSALHVCVRFRFGDSFCIAHSEASDF